MACSNPLRISPNKYSSRTDAPDLDCINSSLGFHNYYTVPCGWCLNCRIDKTNELTDRCEYELCKYSCGAFVTFTFDDYHLNPYQFFDSKTNQIRATLSKKSAKEFLDRLNKEVHKEFKKHGFNPLCRTDYKYLIVGEYGTNGQVFDRPHFHALFFGLDFAFCERLFWRAWQFKGSIQVGAIKNGGIGYVLKYLDKQSHGKEAFYMYDYYHLQRPFQTHSIGLGSGLYKDQLKYISTHEGNYRWRGKDKPVPSYWKNKFLITAGSSWKSKCDKYLKDKEKALNLYNIRIKSFDNLQQHILFTSRQREYNLSKKLQMNGQPLFNHNLVAQQIDKMIYGNHHLPTNHDKDLVKTISVSGEPSLSFGSGIPLKKKLTTRDLMKLHLDYNKIRKKYGFEIAEKYIFPDDKIPF